MDIRIPYLTPTALSQALEMAMLARRSARHQRVMQQLSDLAKR